MNAEEKLIVYLLRNLISGKPGVTCSELINTGINWDRLRQLISYHELQPFLYPLLKDSANFIPLDILTFLKKYFFYSIIHCQRLLREFSSISTAFKQEGIRVVSIKGTAFLEDTYVNMPARLMTDIDLLVEKSGIHKAKEVLSRLGFIERLDDLTEEYWLEKQCHIAFIKNLSEKERIFLDLHFSLDFKRKGSEALPELWSRVRNGKLSAEDALFCLALHQRRFGKVFCLKHIVDAGLILKKYQDSFDWDYVFRQTGSGRIRSTMFFLLMQVKIIFDEEINLPELRVFGLSRFKIKLIQSLIQNNIFSGSLKQKSREIYFKSHLLLYDDFLEPLIYLLNIPQEQFAKFYGLEPYTKKTKAFYNFRIAYGIYRFLLYFITCERV